MELEFRGRKGHRVTIEANAIVGYWEDGEGTAVALSGLQLPLYLVDSYDTFRRALETGKSPPVAVPHKPSERSE